jgi:hypothetical protein
MNEISRTYSAFYQFFSRRNLSPAVDAFLFVWRIELVESVSAFLTFDPVIFLSCIHIFFPKPITFLFTIFSCYLIMCTCFHWLLSLHFSPCVTEVIELFTLVFLCPLGLIPVCFFCFHPTLLTTWEIKSFFSFLYLTFFCYLQFGTEITKLRIKYLL